MIVDPGLNKKIKKENGSAVVLPIMLIVVGLLTISIAFGQISAKTYDLRHTITVDGDSSDWIGTPPSTTNSSTISNEELIWSDAVGDERTDFSSPDSWVDLKEFRMTADSNYLYILIKLNDTSTLTIGTDGGTFIAICLDYDQINNSGQTYFAGESDTQVDSNAAWEYQIVVNLADSRYSGTSPSYITHPLNESTNNWGAVFQVLNSSWSHIYVSGDNGTAGLLAVNCTTGTIEMRISWNILQPTSNILRVSALIARGWSDYSTNQGGTWDIDSFSDALDCITTTGPNTWDEVGDGTVNYYLDVDITQIGGPTIPELPVFLGTSLIALFIFFARDFF